MKNLKDFTKYLNENINIQDRSDAINHFGWLAKNDIPNKIESLADEYTSDREYNDSSFLKDYDIVLKKYGLYDDVIDYVNREDELFIDPAGGHGLHSHESVTQEEQLKKETMNMKNLKNFNEFINEEYGVINREKEYHGNVEQFRYLDIEVVKNGLWLHLNEDGKKEAEEENNLNWEKFSDYFDDIQGNSEYRYFDDIGEAGFGLTSAPGITDGYYYNDDGKLTDDENEDSNVYWFPNYMVEDFTETLLEKGKVFFERAEEAEGGGEPEPDGDGEKEKK